MKRRTIRQNSVAELRNQIKGMYDNKYYNLFMNNFKWEGLTPQEENYVMRQFWATGSLAAFLIPHTTDMLGFAPYVAQSYNMYDYPEQMMLINKRNSPAIPSGVMVNGKDAVIGFIQENHKPIAAVVRYYVDRIVETELVLNTSLQTHKLPFVIGITPTDLDKANDIISRILNDEVVIFADMEELQSVKTLATETPYIIDKLYQYKVSLENELLTYLGIDNLNVEKGERLIVDEVNANNALINCYNKGMLECLQDWTEEIKEVLGVTISVKSTLEVADSVHEDEPAKEVEDNDER